MDDVEPQPTGPSGVPPAAAGIVALHVDGDPAERRLLQVALRQAGCDVEIVAAGSLAEARQVMASRVVVDVVLLDLGLPDGERLATLGGMVEAAPSTPVVVLTDLDDEGQGLAALRLGAQDSLAKRCLTPGELSRAVRFAVERDALARQARTLASIEAAGRSMGTDIGPFLAEVAGRLGAADRHLRARVVVEQGQDVTAVGHDEHDVDPDDLWRTSLPLPDADSVRGELLAWSVRPGGLRPEDTPFLDRVAGQVGDSIHAAHTTSSRTGRSRHLQALHAVAQLPAVVWTTDRDLRLTSIRGAGMDGLASPPATGDSLVDYFGEGEDAMPITEHRKALNGERRTYSFWWDDRWWRVGLEPLTGEDGDILGLVGLSLDTTSEKRALDEVERERTRYEALFAHSTDVIVLLDDDSRLVDVNPAGCELLGSSREALIGSRIGELVTIPETDAEQSLLRHREQLKKQGHLAGTFLVETSSGEPREVEYSATAHVRPGVHMAVGRDVTRRQQFERDLADSEQQFRSLAETASEGIFRLRLVPDRAYEYANPAIEQITGFTADAVLSDPLLLRRRTHPKDIVEDSEQQPRRLRFQRADGEWRWLELRQVPVRNDRRDVVAVQGVVLDVTAEQQRADALRETLNREQEATEELRRVAAMKDTFLRAVSHELRTPVTVVSGLASTLQEHRDRLSESEIDLLFQRLQEHADRLIGLLDDLLDIDRLTMTRNIKVQRERIDLEELVRRTSKEVDLGQRTLQLDLAPTTAEVEPSKVERIVHNLLANAARHTPEGTTVQVAVRTDESGGATITVVDDGPGIPVELHGSILEPFTQGPAAADAAKPGTGIGLSIVNVFARLHGGHVVVDDAPGGGTSITVTLPRAGAARGPVPSGRDRELPARGLSGGDSAAFASKRTLLAVSRSIEAEAVKQAAAGDEPMLVGLFQDPHYRVASEDVYRDVARRGGDVVLGHVGASQVQDLATLALAPEHPLGQEWTVLLASPEVCAALVAYDTGTVGRGATIESARLFRFEITTAPDVVAAHLRRLIDEAGDALEDDQRQRLRRAADHAGADDSLADVRSNQLHAALQEQVERIRRLQDNEPLAMTDPRTGAHTPAFLTEYLGWAGPRAPDVALIGFHITSTGRPSTDLDRARTFADLVRDHTGPGDVLVHDGDERWHVLLPAMPEDAAEQLAQTILGAHVAQRATDDDATIAAALTVTPATDVDLEALAQRLEGVASRDGALAHVEHRSADGRSSYRGGVTS